MWDTHVDTRGHELDTIHDTVQVNSFTHPNKRLYIITVHISGVSREQDFYLSVVSYKQDLDCKLFSFVCQFVKHRVQWWSDKSK